MNQTASSETSLGLRILRNPLTRVILFFVMAWIFSQGMKLLLPYPSLKPEQALAVTGAELWLRALRSLVPVVLSYWLLVRFIEGRKLTELAAAKIPRHVPLGWLVGMGVLLLAAGAMAAVGAYRVHGVDSGVYLLGPFVVLGLLPGITEEIVARGILFRVVEDGLGTWFALVFSALLFGAGHLANPNATIWSSAAIAIEAGLLLGMAYAWTRSLWFAMALHAAWNFTQGPLLGIAVSGIAANGLLESTTQGNKWLSGGEFGAEASILTVIICVSIAGYFTRRAVAAGQIRKPLLRSPRTYLILFGVFVLVSGGVLLLPLPIEGRIGIVVALAIAFLLGSSPAPSRCPASPEGMAQ